MMEDYFKGLADASRLRIINLLLNGELCGCDIQYVLNASQSNVSRHLTYLKRCGLVLDRREGFRVYYRLAHADSREHKSLLSFLRGALRETIFISDARRLRRAIKDGACTLSEISPLVRSRARGRLREARR